MKLIAIGDIGYYKVYIDMTKEEAIGCWMDENIDPDDLRTPEEQGRFVKEIIVENGVFGAYDIWEES